MLGTKRKGNVRGMNLTNNVHRSENYMDRSFRNGRIINAIQNAYHKSVIRDCLTWDEAESFLCEMEKEGLEIKERNQDEN